MMLPTHVIFALSLSSVLLLFSPDSSLIIFSLAFVGGVVPDIDLLFGEHRRTLHYPVYSFFGLIGSFLAAIVLFNVYTVGLLSLMIGLTSHGLGDIAGSGLEHKPWKRTTNKGIYNHYVDEWISPKYIVGYDGSLRDLSLLVVLSVFVYLQYSIVMYVEYIIIGLLVIGISYTIVRKYLPDLEIYLYDTHWVFRKISDLFFHGEELK